MPGRDDEVINIFTDPFKMCGSFGIGLYAVLSDGASEGWSSKFWSFGVKIVSACLNIGYAFGLCDKICASIYFERLYIGIFDSTSNSTGGLWRLVIILSIAANPVLNQSFKIFICHLIRLFAVVHERLLLFPADWAIEWLTQLV
jgi:hypothetical protein